MGLNHASGGRSGGRRIRILAVAGLAVFLAAGAALRAEPAAGGGQTGPILAGPGAAPVNPTIFTLKFGYQTSPAADSFGDAWLIGLCWDIGINRNFAFGFELQPAYRSNADLGIHSIPMLGWMHLKVGENLGRFVPALKPLKLYAGIGAGAEAVMTIMTVDELTETEFGVHFAYKLMFGAILDLGQMSLVLEYQSARVSNPALDPDFWRHHIFLGFNF